MVQCAKCGFLAARHLQTRGFLEVEENIRKTGEIPSYQRATIYGNVPLCFRMAHPLQDELQPNDDAEHRLLVMTRERSCDEFLEWQQGFSPKEHKEMLREERMLEWQAKQEKADQSWREQQAEVAARRHKEQLWIIGGVVAAATVLGNLIAAFLQ